MPIPRVRFTVKRMIVAVAVGGIASFVCEMSRRSSQYALKSRHYENREVLSRDLMVSFSSPNRPEIVAICRVEYARNLAFAEFEGRMKRKYRRVARYPFLPVSPDTPEPE